MAGYKVDGRGCGIGREVSGSQVDTCVGSGAGSRLDFASSRLMQTGRMKDEGAPCLAGHSPGGWYVPESLSVCLRAWSRKLTSQPLHAAHLPTAWILLSASAVTAHTRVHTNTNTHTLAHTLARTQTRTRARTRSHMNTNTHTRAHTHTDITRAHTNL